MRAHVIPVAYLKGFSVDPNPEPRLRRIYAVARDRYFWAALGDACVLKDYYTKDADIDDALFHDQETSFGTLVERIEAGQQIEAAVHTYIWLLKARSRVILDHAKDRELIAKHARTVPLGGRSLAIVRTQDDLITSDDPVTMFGVSHGQGGIDCAFMLPLTPRILALSLPSGRFSIRNSVASAKDVELLNRWQCERARFYVLMHDEIMPTTRVHQHMPASPWRASSGAVFFNIQRTQGSVIYNFLSHANQPLSFLEGS